MFVYTGHFRSAKKLGTLMHRLCSMLVLFIFGIYQNKQQLDTLTPKSGFCIML